MASSDVLFEFCAENATHVERALAAGARRIELCDNLAVGGTTPSAGVIAQTVRMAEPYGAAVRVMIRPRGGSFVYTSSELEAMAEDLALAARLGAEGVVFGCLVPSDADAYAAGLSHDLATAALPGTGYAGSYRLDAPSTMRLADAAREAGGRRGRALGITFHMAFDELCVQDQLSALDAFGSWGIDRVLTHGGAPTEPIEEHAGHLRLLMARAGKGITILPGAGITYRNAESVAALLGARELHGTRIVDLAAPR